LAGEAGIADAPLGAATGPVIAFGDHQLGQKAEIAQLLTLSGSSDLGEPVADGGRTQNATTLLDGRGRGLLGDSAPSGHEGSRPSKMSYCSTEGSGRSSAGTAAERCSARTTTRRPG
jgi:hypothetical protein